MLCGVGVLILFVVCCFLISFFSVVVYHCFLRAVGYFENACMICCRVLCMLCKCCVV